MVHCDNNYIVVSGLAKDFLWEVSGCCCDDASLKLGGGPSLNSWTVCFMWKQGVFFSPICHTHSIQLNIYVFLYTYKYTQRHNRMKKINGANWMFGQRSVKGFTAFLIYFTYLSKKIEELWTLYFSTGVWIIMRFIVVLPLLCSCLHWPLTFYYLSHTDTTHLRWSASGLVPLLSSIPLVMTLNSTLQGSVPFYNGRVSSSCIVAVCQRFLLSFTDLFSTSCLCGVPVVITGWFGS